MNSEQTRTICFDLDGTICETDEMLPIPERYYKSVVKPKIRTVVRSFYSKGYKIIIDTARTSSAKGLTKYLYKWKIRKLTQEQLKQWDVPYHELRVGIKPAADIYIDDKSVPVQVLEKR